MQVKIGVQNVARELVFETDMAAKDVKHRISEAIANDTVFELADDKGASIIVPADKIGYIELGAEAKRRIGFGIGE